MIDTGEDALHIEMSQDASCNWVYRDATQSELLKFILKELAWDISEMDFWIGYSPHWRGYPKIRRDLIEARDRLVRIHSLPEITNKQRISLIIDGLVKLHSLGLKSSSFPKEISLKIHSSGLNVRMRNLVRSTPDRDRRILFLWNDFIGNGQKYGAQKLLSSQFGVSTSYIRNLVKDSVLKYPGNPHGY